MKPNTSDDHGGLHAVNGTNRRAAGQRARAHQLGTCGPSALRAQCGVLFLLFLQPGGCMGDEEGGIHDSRSPASRLCTQGEQGVSVPPARALGKRRRETREGGAVQVQPCGVHQPHKAYADFIFIEIRAIKQATRLQPINAKNEELYFCCAFHEPSVDTFIYIFTFLCYYSKTIWVFKDTRAIIIL